MGPLRIIALWSFWLATAAVLYAYAVYPPVIWLLSRLFGRKDVAPATNELPKLSLLIAAYNEETVIAQRIENALALNYPADRLEIVVASDGSNDRTAQIVREYAARGVRLLEYVQRRGKATVLNESIPRLQGDIVLLSDANTWMEPSAARSLVRWFSDDAIGVVCGRLVITDPKTGRNADGLYWKYETFLKKNESRLGALLGSNGGIYAIRRSLYQPIPDGTIIDDFVIPLVARQRSGCRIVYDCQAVAHEESAPDIRAEFRRRCRIGAGGFQAIAMLWRLLNPSQGWVAFTFISHKVLRWLCPLFLLAMLICSALLVQERVYWVALVAQVAFYLCSIAVPHLPGRLTLLRPLRLAPMFTGMNLALLFGLGRWLRRSQSGAWVRTPREEVMKQATLPLAPEPQVARPRRRRMLAPALGLAFVAVAAMQDAWRDIVRLGLRDEELSYVLLAPVVIFWLAWARRDRLAECSVGRQWSGMLVLLAGAGTYWYGYYSDPFFWRAGAVVTAVGAFVTATGFDLARAWAPALLATLFLIPVDPNGRYRFAGPLQEMTAIVTQNLCDLLGMPVSRAGNLLTINGVGVTVAEACNGMRMVLTLLMVCYLVAFTIPMKGYLRLLFLLTTPLVAVVSNVIRLVPTVWIFGHRTTEAAERFHDMSGWVMTIASFLLLAGIFRLVKWATETAIGAEQLPAT